MNAPRTCRRTAASQGGFGLVEMLIATMVLAFALMGFAAIMSAAVRETVKGKKRTEAQQLATSTIEQLRGLDYNALATVGGNPAGSLPQVKTVGKFRVTTSITWVNDPVPGGIFTTYKDYKTVKVDVTEPATGKTWVSMQTQFAPPGAPGLNEAVVKVDVVDGDDMPVQDAVVRIADGPSPALEDRTDAAGKVVFPGLVPTTTGQTYVLTATKPGYHTRASDLPPNEPGRFPAAGTSTVSKLIHLIREYPIRVTLTTADGSLFANPAAPAACTPLLLARATDDPNASTLQSPMPTRPFDAYAVGGTDLTPGTYTFTASCIPASALSGGPGSTPRPNATAWFSDRAGSTFTATDTPGQPVPINLRMSSHQIARAMFLIKKAGTPLANARVVLKGGPADVDLMAVTNPGGVVSFYVPRSPDGVDDYTLEVTDSTGVSIGVPRTGRAGNATTPVQVDFP